MCEYPAVSPADLQFAICREMDKFIYVCVLIIYYVWRWTATGQTLLQIHSGQPAEAKHFQWASPLSVLRLQSLFTVESGAGLVGCSDRAELVSKRKHNVTTP